MSWLVIIACLMMPKYTRNPVTRMLLEKLEEREKPINLDQEWYHLERDVLSAHLADRYLPSSLDEDTHAFLTSSVEKSDAILTQLYHSFAKAILCWFTSTTTINGLLGRGSMFVFSHAQMLALTGQTQQWHFNSLLDLGAGDGKITSVVASHANEVFVTENSLSMRWRLTSRGYNVLEINAWQDRQYDVILALNLLDRVDDGLEILRQMRDAIDPVNGKVIVALVLPYQPCVESGSSFVPVRKRMPIRGRTIEEQINSASVDLFRPIGFSIERFTRLPYLCEGSFYRDYYVLTDIVFYLTPIVPAGCCLAADETSAVTQR